MTALTDLSDSTELHDAVRRRLAEHEVRYTWGRRAVVEALCLESGPRSAAELTDRLEEIPLSSLYRTLTVLEETGVVDRHHDTEGVARFELGEWLSGHHHHVVCRECGEVEDVPVDTETEASIGRLVQAMAGHAGFEATHHVLEAIGRCRRCRT